MINDFEGEEPADLNGWTGDGWTTTTFAGSQVEILSSFEKTYEGVTYSENNDENGNFLALWSDGSEDIAGLAQFMGTTADDLLKETPLVFDVVEYLGDGLWDEENATRYSERQFHELYPEGANLPDSHYVNPDANLEYEDRRDDLVQGSAAKLTIEDVNAGDILQLDLFFYTEDVDIGDTVIAGLSGEGQDTHLLGVLTTQDPDLNIVPVGDSAYGTFGWDRELRVEITGEILGGSTNNLEVSIGVLNVGDTDGLTGLFIDNFEIL